MKTTKYEIELPTLPDGHELVLNQCPIAGDLIAYWEPGQWVWRPSIGTGAKFPFIARRRETLADWANKQRLFQALAEMRKDCGFDTIIQFGLYGSLWDMHSGSVMHLGVPPSGMHGKLRLEAGKWVDAT